MRWITNLPKDPSRAAISREKYDAIVKGNLIGPPKTTTKYSVEKLEEMGLIGVYDPRLPEDTGVAP